MTRFFQKRESNMFKTCKRHQQVDEPGLYSSFTKFQKLEPQPHKPEYIADDEAQYRDMTLRRYKSES